jgi:hypothetical protein
MAKTEGFLKILHQQGSDKILGATIVARHAGEMISEITLAMVTNQSLSALSGVIHPYPTQAEAIKKRQMPIDGHYSPHVPGPFSSYSPGLARASVQNSANPGFFVGLCARFGASRNRNRISVPAF